MSNSEDPKKSFRWGLWISLALHGLLLAALIIVPLRYFVKSDQDSVAKNESAPSTKSATGGDKGSKGGSAADTQNEVAPENDPFSQAAQDEHVKAELPGQLEEAVQQASQNSEEGNRTELFRLSRKLDRVSSEESVDEIGDRVLEMSGVEERASEPAAEPQEGPFDFNSAQVHDVIRTELENGSFRFQAEMVDSAGRSYLTDLDPETGRSLYDTMQTIKASPLLDRVYRKMAMPLFDKIISAQMAVQTAAQQAAAEEALRNNQADPSASSEPPAEEPSEQASEEPPISPDMEQP